MNAVDLSEIKERAEQGDATEQFRLGVMYATGEGAPEDDAEAVKWFRLAAKQGDAEAQFNLGVMYANGEGVPQNDKEAVKWYSLSAKQGETSAQHNLGIMYEMGRGVPQDYKEACVSYGADDIVMSTKISGTPCTVIQTPYVQKVGTKQNPFERFLSKNKKLKK